ncbi:hypothetical protein RF11_09888 [Thelohanellus kitauei]|uniref:Uncharacterized protein n=1 Tax=Thelohanellus kitauei TaxID=669202 RepID=A0A0C2IFE0_THEKT|nr:hypothetical protein RF11_09888 [Thelohanellus kitauei]
MQTEEEDVEVMENLLAGQKIIVKGMLWSDIPIESEADDRTVEEELSVMEQRNGKNTIIRQCDQLDEEMRKLSQAGVEPMTNRCSLSGQQTRALSTVNLHRISNISLHFSPPRRTTLYCILQTTPNNRTHDSSMLTTRSPTRQLSAVLRYTGYLINRYTYASNDEMR